MRKSHPPLAETPLLAQQSPFLAMDAQSLYLSRLLQLPRFDVLEEAVLVSHAELLLQLNDVADKETNNC